MPRNLNAIRVLFSTIACFTLLACNGKNTEPKTTVKADSATDSAISPVQPAVPYVFIDDGGKGGIPVLFVHSFGGSTRHWANQLAHLRKTRRAIAMDLRGHGKTPAPLDSNYSVEALATDIERVVDSLDLERVVLVGHSMGGSAAISYAGKYPNRVAALVLEGTPGKSNPEQSKEIMASLKSDQYDTVMSTYMNQILNHAKPATRALETEGIAKLNRAVSLKMIEGLFDFNPVPILQKFPGPSIFITTPAENEPTALHHSFPKIPHKVVSGTSHWIHLDKPDQFNSILDAFLLKVGDQII